MDKKTTRQRIKELYADGLTTGKIAEVLNSEGYKTVTGKAWTQAAVSARACRMGLRKNVRFKKTNVKRRATAPTRDSTLSLELLEIAAAKMSDSTKLACTRAIVDKWGSR